MTLHAVAKTKSNFLTNNRDHRSEFVAYIFLNCWLELFPEFFGTVRYLISGYKVRINPYILYAAQELRIFHYLKRYKCMEFEGRILV